MSKVKKIVIAGLLVAVGVSASTFYIPVGIAKCFPVQHFINVMAAVTLGPVYGVGMAFTTSLLRNLLGTGSLLAFPGSMCGALLAGLLYKYGHKTIWAFIGEIVGTGLIGSLLAYPVAVFLLSKKVALFAFVIPFSLSTLVGAASSLILLEAMNRTGLIKSLRLENKSL